MERKQNKGLAAAALAVLIVLAFLLLTGINGFTAPIIESNGASQQFEALLGVMPDAAGFEQLYGGENDTLTDVPETVKGVYTETSGLGFVLQLSTTQGYTGEPIEFTLAVDAEGKISAVEMTNYPETKDFGADYPQTYIGQDSALAGVNLVAGITYSSSAFKNAVSDGLNVLVSQGLISEGVKDDSQILEELLPGVYPGIVNPAGILQYEELEASGSFQKIMKALNGTGYAFIGSDGSASYLVICNAAGGVLVYDTEGNAVDAASVDALIQEAKAAASDLSPATEPERKLKRLLPEDATATPLSLEPIFNSVTGAYLVESADGVQYAFTAKPYGYNNMPMEIYAVLDENGAIVAMNADEFIFFSEYFDAYELEEDSYKAGFEGLTAGSFTGDEALISGATFSTDGVKTGIADIFQAFDQIDKIAGGESNA